MLIYLFKGALYGEYKVVDNKLACVLHKTSKNEKKAASKFRFVPY